MCKRMQRNNSGFTIIEALAMIVIFGILVILLSVIMARIESAEVEKGKQVCVEWEDAQITDCWSYGMGTSCEHRTEKRCVRYEYNDGGTKAE